MPEPGRVLLTAFEPFDGTGLNASEQGCRAFLERWGSEFDVHFALLPSEYDRDVEAVERARAAGPVDAVLHTGQMSGARGIRVERLAVNVRYGNVPGAGTGRALPTEEIPQHRIDPEGPAALFSTLPVDDLAAAIRAAGVPAVVSNHAGIYLCNHVLYHSLLRSEREGRHVPTGFLHIPCLPEQAGEGVPSMTREQTGLGIRAAVALVSGAPLTHARALTLTRSEHEHE